MVEIDIECRNEDGEITIQETRKPKLDSEHEVIEYVSSIDSFSTNFCVYLEKHMVASGLAKKGKEIEWTLKFGQACFQQMQPQ
jgi:hypothetical protein